MKLGYSELKYKKTMKAGKVNYECVSNPWKKVTCIFSLGLSDQLWQLKLIIFSPYYLIIPTNYNTCDAACT